MRLVKTLALVFLATTLAFAAPDADEQHHHAPAAPPEKFGEVHFSVSCNAEAQQEFGRALAILHSFWYEEAGKAFVAVSEKDPGCAMGYWGYAMSLYHPLWEPPNAETLKKGWEAVEKAKALGGKTEREQAYIAAMETFYRDADKPAGAGKLDHRTRALAYEKAMEQLHQRFPQDNEAGVFYALALLGTALPTDKTYANQLKAGQILENVLAQEPNHPGVAHYIIHSYDTPSLASRALAAARAYAKIAPSVPHALHMPSHIFTRLGLWQESISSNLASAAAAKEYGTSMRMDGAWDQWLHPMDYLEYAYLQSGQDREAKRVLDEVAAAAKAQPESMAAAYAFAAIPARYALERHRWAEAATLELHPAGFAWSRYRGAEAFLYSARAIGAARSGNLDAARGDITHLERLRDALMQAKDNYWADQVEIQRREAAAWLARGEGENEEALELMRSAATLEDATEKHAVTPGSVIPAREFLGDLLLELNQPSQALREYESSLESSPNRLNSLYGAARAAELGGDREKARTYYARLMKLGERADGTRPALQQAKTFLAKK